MKNSYYSVLFAILTLFIGCIYNCDRSTKPTSNQMKKLVQKNNYYKLHNYRDKYDLNKIIIKATNKQISKESIINCLNSFLYKDKSIGILNNYIAPDFYEYISARGEYPDIQKNYIIRIEVKTYEDYDSAKIGLENILQGYQYDPFDYDNACNFDLCFIQNNIHYEAIRRMFLWANIVVLYEVLNIPTRDRYVDKSKTNLSSEDLKAYFEMNNRFLREFGSAFEEHLINCQL